MKKYFPELDGFRGVGVIIVLSSHYGLYNSPGWIMMGGFFVLSGFLISGILLNQKSKPITFKEKFKTYWIRRSLRIFPVYYLYLFILLITYFLLHYPLDYDIMFPYLLTYSFNMLSFTDKSSGMAFKDPAHLWSLSVEEQFYLLLPFLVLLLSHKWLKVITLIALLSGMPFRYFFAEFLQHYYDKSQTGMIIYTFTVSHFEALFTGVAINLFNTAKWKHTGKLALVAFAVAVTAGAANYLLTPEYSSQGIAGYINTIGYPYKALTNYQHVWTYTVWNIFFGLLISYLVSELGNRDSFIRKVLRHKWLVQPGKISYGMYVYHFGILSAFFAVLHPYFPYIESHRWAHILFFLIFFAIVYIISLISFRYFESKFLKMKPGYAGVKKEKLTEGLTHSESGGGL